MLLTLNLFLYTYVLNWVNSDIMFPAAGDGCFYIGMGGKGQLPNPSYEPYQCCPSKPSKGSKVAKLAAKGSAPSKTPTKQTKKVEKLARLKPVSKADHPIKINRENIKEKPVKPEKGKGKKGFFGTGKYIWWW